MVGVLEKFLLCVVYGSVHRRAFLFLDQWINMESFGIQVYICLKHHKLYLLYLNSP